MLLKIFVSWIILYRELNFAVRRVWKCPSQQVKVGWWKTLAFTKDFKRIHLRPWTVLFYYIVFSVLAVKLLWQCKCSTVSTKLFQTHMNATGTEQNLSCIKLMTYGMIKILLSMQKHFQKLLGLTKHRVFKKKKKE